MEEGKAEGVGEVAGGEEGGGGGVGRGGDAQRLNRWGDCRVGVLQHLSCPVNAMCHYHVSWAVPSSSCLL